MATGLALFLALGAAPVWAANAFIENLHKAQKRVDPVERLEYYGRALKAWEPADGMALLGQAHFGRGEALTALWRYAEAETDLSRALDLDPNNSRAHLLRGRARLNTTKANEAVQDLLEYVGRAPGDLEGLLLLAQAQLKAGKGDASLKACALVQQTAPDDSRGWLCEARARMARKDYRGAESALDLGDEKARHRQAAVLTERAACRIAGDRHEAALADYSDALPLLEASLTELERQRAPAPHVAEAARNAALAYYGRARVRDYLAQPAEALTDYLEACGLGHDQACARADAMQADGQVKVSDKPKRRKPRRPTGNGGDRIYGG